MRNRKGFTLIELIAVIIIIGVISSIAIISITQYLTRTKDTVFSSYEKSMVAATQNKIVNCLSNNENCDLPYSDGEQSKVFLEYLIGEGYIDNLKDPKSSKFCEELSSYVAVEKLNNNKYGYIACLYCDSYKTDDDRCNVMDGPVGDIHCGTVTGASTTWTKEDRTIIVGCESPTNACGRPSFSKKFSTTTEYGEVAIRDKNGKALVPACGNIAVYVDKSMPTCSVEAVGEYNEETQWYLAGTTANIRDQLDVGSGLAGYGMGLSYLNPSYNNQNSVDLSTGITTVFGFVKDNAGNENLCSKTIKIGKSPPKISIYYGHKIFPGGQYSLSNINMDGNSFTTTSTSPKITINNLSRFEDVERVKIIFSESIPASTTGTIKSGEMTKTTIMQQGSKEAVFLVPKGTYESFQITLGDLNAKTYKISRIEVITQKSTIWSNDDVELYVESVAGDMQPTVVSYDNGASWTDEFHKKYTSSTTNSIVAKNVYDLESQPKAFTINIDRSNPVVVLTANKKTSGTAVTTGTYSNEPLNFTFNISNVGASGARIYYCKDVDNTCTPNIEIVSGTVITEFNNITDNYYVRYYAESNAGTRSSIGQYRALIDVEKPICTFGSLSVFDVKHTSQLEVSCSDTKSGMVQTNLTAADFALSNSNMAITNVTTTLTNGVLKTTVSLRGDTKGTTVITLNNNKVHDVATSYNDSISKSIEVNGKFAISVDAKGATNPGYSTIYESYGSGWYSNQNLSTSITSVTKPVAPAGFMFDGYYTGNDGTGTKIIDANGSIVGANTTFTANSTIYANYIRCGNGYYCSSGVKTACPAGTYGNGTTNGSTQAESCKTCDKGYYCTGGVSRTECGNGKYNDLTGQTSSSACKSISAGCYGSNGTTSCPNSCTGRTKYSAAGATSCSTVSTGYYTTGCNSSNNNCTGQTKCVAGNYCTNGVSNACGGGKYSAAGATSCSTISAGCYGTSASTACPNSCSGRTKYSGAGASSCSTVSAGYYTTGCNSSNNNCTGQSQCPAGTYCSNGVSAACTGRTKYSGAGASSCSTVSNGYYTTGCNSSNNNCTGQSQCPAGTYCSNGVSAACTGRTKFSGAGATSCSTVSTGHYTTGCNGSSNNCTGQSQCTAGNYCTNGISYKCATYYYSGAGATSCYDNTTPSISNYTDTMVKDTLTNMTICGLGSDTGSGLKQIEYYFSCNTTHKTATISGDCATITPSSPCSGAVFYYRIRDDRNWTAWKNTGNFGAYFLLARIYNKLLTYNPASNNASNITFHVNRINGNLAGRLTEIGNAALNNSTSVSNEEIVKRFYRGILGREPSSSEVSGHVNSLKNGMSRATLLDHFINSAEAVEKRQAWGY